MSKVKASLAPSVQKFTLFSVSQDFVSKLKSLIVLDLRKQGERLTISDLPLLQELFLHYIYFTLTLKDLPSLRVLTL